MKFKRMFVSIATCLALCTTTTVVGVVSEAAAAPVAEVLLEPELIADINTASDGSNPGRFLSIGTTTYFAATSNVHGSELWKFAELSGVTELVVDLAPGTDDSSPTPVGEVGENQLLFVADRPDTGREFYRTYGTSETTELLADIAPGDVSSSPRDITEVAGGWLFSARDASFGRELWRTGGGAAEKLSNINPGGNAGVGSITAVEERDAAFFIAEDPGGLQQLYRWDDDAGVVLVEPPAGLSSWRPVRMANFDGALALIAWPDGTTVGSLFFVEGDTAAALTVTEAGLAGNVSNVYVSSGQLFVQVFNGGSPTIWRFTSPEIPPKKLLTDVIMREPVPFKTGLLFQGDDGDGAEPWVTDGTAAGTMQIGDIRPGADSSSPRGFVVDRLGKVAGFRATGSDGTVQLFWTNGGAGSIHPVPIASQGTPGTELHQTTQGAWLFGFGDLAKEPWTSNFKVSMELADVNEATRGSDPTGFTEFDGKIYFTANDEVHDREVWSFDPTTGQTTRNTSFDFRPVSLTATETHLFFASTNDELWARDRSGSSFGLLASFSDIPDRLTVAGSKVFFLVGSLFDEDRHLWVTDGTSEGTVDLGEFFDVRSVLVFGNMIMFWPDFDDTGREPWMSDGTLAGTFPLADLEPGSQGSYSPQVVTGADGVGYFAAVDALWRTDGTPGGTTVVPTVGIAEVRDVVVHGDALLVIGDDTDGGGEDIETLWHLASSGAVPTQLDTSSVFVDDFEPPYAVHFGTTTMIPYGDNDLDTAGFFAIDGTTIRHIGLVGADVGVLGATVIDGQAVLRLQDDDTSQDELWKSDGTQDGTVRVTDFLDDDVINIEFIGSRAYLGYPSTTAGNEPHFIELAEPEVENGFVPLLPGRVLDTRSGQQTVDGLFAGIGRVAANGVVELPIAGRAGVPAQAQAVSLNVTLVRPAGPGFATVWPCDEQQPTASNVNYVGGDVVPNAVLSKLSAGGKVCIFTNQAADVLVDTNGAFMDGSGFDPVVPGRVLDTREGQETVDGDFAEIGRIGAGAVLELPVAGRAGVPAEAVAVSLNVTLVRPDGPGFATLWPCGAEQPKASNVNFAGGDVVPNAVLSKTSDTGTVCIFTNQAADVIVDVNGSFDSSSQFSPLVPGRLLDTRPGQDTIDGDFAGDGIVPAGEVFVLAVSGRSSVPVDASAVSLNVTVVRPAGPGFSTVWPCDESQPEASNINFAGGDVVPNAVLSKLSADGTICIFTNQAAHLVVDVNGAFTRSAS